MFPDIALQGTAAPETVPSFPVKAAPGFEEAFAGLLAETRSVRLLDHRSLGEGGQADPLPLPAPAPGLDPGCAAALPVPRPAEDAAVASEAWRAIAIPADVLPAEASLSEAAADVTSNSFDHVGRPFRGADSQSPETGRLAEDMAPAVADEITPKIESDDEGEAAPIVVAAPVLAVPLPEPAPAVAEKPSLEFPPAETETPLPVTAMPTLAPQPTDVPTTDLLAEAPIPAIAAADRAVAPGDDLLRQAFQQEPLETISVGHAPVVETPSIEEPHTSDRGPANHLRQGSGVQEAGHYKVLNPRQFNETQYPDVPAALRAPAHGRPEEVRARLASILATLPQVPQDGVQRQSEQVSQYDNIQQPEPISPDSSPLPTTNLVGPAKAGHYAGPPKGGHYEVLNETQSPDAPAALTPPAMGRLEAGRARLASILATLAEVAPNASVPRPLEQVSELPEQNTLPRFVAAVRDQIAVSDAAGSNFRDTFESGSHQKPDASLTLARELMSLAGRVAPHDPQVLAALAQVTGSDAPESNGLQFSAVPVRPLTPVLLNMTPRLSENLPRATLPAEAETARSIVQTLRMQAASGGGTATLTLRPEYLGSLTVSLHVKEGGVVATMQAENSAVRSWIEANVQILRDGLAEQGLKLEQVIVSERQAPDVPEDARRERQTGEQAPPRRMRRRDDSKFEVIA